VQSAHRTSLARRATRASGNRFETAVRERQGRGVEDRGAAPIEDATIEGAGERVLPRAAEAITAPRTEAAIHLARGAALARGAVADPVAAEAAIDGTRHRRFSEYARPVAAPRRRSAVVRAGEDRLTRPAETIAAEADRPAILRTGTERTRFARLADAVSTEGRPAIEWAIEGIFAGLAHQIPAKDAAVARTRLKLARIAPAVTANEPAIHGTRHRLARVADAVAAERDSAILGTADWRLEGLADAIAAEAAAAIDGTGDGLVVFAHAIATNGAPAVDGTAPRRLVRFAEAIAAEGWNAAIYLTVRRVFSGFADAIAARCAAAIGGAIERSLARFAESITAEGDAAVLRARQRRFGRFTDLVAASGYAAGRRGWSARHRDAGAAVTRTVQGVFSTLADAVAARDACRTVVSARSTVLSRPAHPVAAETAILLAREGVFRRLAGSVAANGAAVQGTAGG
jgi:hypothetical protein